MRDDDTPRGLTIDQPYAFLIAAGRKRIENRSWRTHYRGDVYVHAARGPVSVLPSITGDVTVNDRESPLMTRGSVVAVARVVACLPKPPIAGPVHPQWVAAGLAHLWEDRHAHGIWCWVLDNLRPLHTPVPWRGKQGLWRVPPELQRAVEVQW